jgi:hypothetical protein
MSEQRSTLLWAIAWVFIIVIVVTSYATYEGIIDLGEAVIGLATEVLAFATLLLAITEIHEGNLNRELQSQESKNERNRLRLKEQLEGFYSPIMPYVDDFNDKTPRSVFYIEKEGLLNYIQSKYEFLASPELRELFRRFYDKDDYIENWGEIINSIHDTLKEDFKRFTKKYNELTE